MNLEDQALWIKSFVHLLNETNIYFESLSEKEKFIPFDVFACLLLCVSLFQ